jgi:hypothetical protein
MLITVITPADNNDIKIKGNTNSLNNKNTPNSVDDK